MIATMLRPLAASMQPIIEAIGFDAALTLVSRLGGTRVHVAKQPLWRDRLCEAIGLEKAAMLANALGPGPLEIPRCTAWMLGRRNEEVVNRSLAGESQTELALRFNLTERHIRTILTADQGVQAPQAAPQPDLFTDPTNPTDRTEP